jgi:pimeloyl-ACP methyl ester carboxylesterase
MNCQPTAYLVCADDVRLAYALTPGTGPTCVFLPGYRSDMTGTKVLALEAEARVAGQAMLRLDYSGHGESGGAFEDGSISRWRQDVLALIDSVTSGPLLLVGSSMGGWLALLAALARPGRVIGLVLIAPAPDFTRWGADIDMSPAFIADGEANCVLQADIPIACPVRLLHGQQDEAVPWQLSLELAEKLRSNDVQLTLIKDGDHRLSRPQDIVTLARTVDDLRGLLSSMA